MLGTEFFLTSLVVVLIPGTGVIYTVSNGLFWGWRAGLAAAAGCTLGIVPHLIACILGLSAILHLSALAFQAVKFVGAAYLLYIAWTLWRDTGTLRFNTPTAKSGAWRIAARGILINILNPKLSIFFLAFLPQFISGQGPSPILQMLLLAVVFMAMTLVIFIAYGFAAHGVRRFVGQAPQRIRNVQKTFAAIFAALGIRLALMER